MDLLKEVIDLIVDAVKLGGGCWLLVGVIILALGLKDKTGPQIQNGIWQIVGGGLILSVAVLFTSLVS